MEGKGTQGIEGLSINVQLRHGGEALPAIINRDNTLNGVVNVKLVQPDRAIGIAPGQFAAFYVGHVCIGSGVVRDKSMLDNVQRHEEVIRNEKL
jgi:tRNA U34 2-thiouridine synthase MnmA/TrmU